MQPLVHTLLINRAEITPDPEIKGYLMACVIAAMNLLVASSTSDLRAGLSLLVDGEGIGHRVFFLSLLIVYGLMIAASIEVLMSTAEDDATVVMSAVIILFIAGLVRSTHGPLGISVVSFVSRYTYTSV